MESLVKSGIFDEFEKATKLKVPVYLQNLLIANGLDSEILLKDITDSDIAVCEEYTRTVLHKNIPQHEYKHFYGPIYCYNPSKYQMVLGHKKIIFLMKDFFQNKNKTKEEKSTMTECAISFNYSVPSKSSSDAGAIQSRKDKKLTIDLTQENKHIFVAIKKWVETQHAGPNLSNINLNNIKVCTSQDTHDEDKMMCIITCFCRTPIKILKVKKSTNAQPRWIYTNFYTHFKRKHLRFDPKVSNSAKDIENVSRKGSSGEPSEVPEEVPTKKSSASIMNYFIKHGNSTTSTTTEATTNVESPNLGPNSSRVTDYSASHNLFRSSKFDFSFDNCHKKLECEKLNSRINLIQSTKFKMFIPSTSTNSSTDLHSIQEQPRDQPLSVETSDTGLSTTVSTTYATSSATSDEHIKLLPAKISGNKENLLPELLSEDLSPSKWATCKYSREERSRRKREKFHDNQTLLTNFYPILQKIHSVIDANINNNPNIVDMLNDTVNIISPHDNDSSSDSSITRQTFLENLIKIARINKNRLYQKNLYDDDFKKFSLYLFYLGGKLLYETLHANLNSVLPSLSTLYRFRNKLQDRTEEGQFNFNGLNTFLEQRNLPKFVWISEDGTRITGKIEYDPITNKILGFVLPLEDGVPKNDAYVATSAETIEGYFQTGEKAEYAYCIMAQPLDTNSPAYCLAVFGTNNKFNSLDVSMRWTKMIEEASIYGIEIMGFSSDGDTRLLKAMKIGANFPDKMTENQQWFHMNNNNKFLCFQDQTHVLTKLRTRFLKPGVKLPMGKYMATVGHLDTIIKNKSKDKHQLTRSDINLEDKMNFNSARKISTKVVQELLGEIENSHATQIYLKMMDYLIAALIDKDESLNNRIYKIWYSVCFLRLWRKWLKRESQYSLQENFITLNCYTCIEINAHMLVRLIELFKDSNVLDAAMFCPWLLGSQPCEAMFRSARSLTSTFSTVVNFSIKDILGRIDRISFINYVTNDLKNAYIFPRETKRHKKQSNFTVNEDILNNVDIEKIVKTALKDALNDARNLEMDVTEDDCYSLDIKESKNNNIIDNLNISTNLDEDHPRDHHLDLNLDEPTDFELDSEISSHQEEVENNLQKQILINDFMLDTEDEEVCKKEDAFNLKDFSYKNMKITENSPFIKINLPQNKTAVIKKSSYCWLLSDNNGKVSSDRLKRFIVSDKKNVLKPTVKKKRKNTLDKKQNQKKKLKGKSSENSKHESTLDDSKYDTVNDTGSDTEEETNNNDNIIYDDSTDTETFSDLETEQDPIVDTMKKYDETVVAEVDTMNIDSIASDCYYAVFYDEDWFIGKVLEKIRDKFKIIFLKKENNKFVWPEKEDIDKVEQKYIFYGPITLLGSEIGSDRFQLKRVDLLNIGKKYNEFIKMYS